ncbi:uncharacterized protein LOC142338325 [Convolutriloba macropyga]|uniref:uncharacterized protein LOC142338325 n=1 Tax=Convolutriloba macropyga TaxID=536237 RepID=UPI003F51D009
MRDPLTESPFGALQPARVFTSVEPSMPNLTDKKRDSKISNSIVVSGKASKIVEPDLGEIRFLLSSKPKSSTNEAKESVLRREDYVKQVLSNFLCRSSDIQVTHLLEPVTIEKQQKEKEASKEKQTSETYFIFKSEFWVKLRRWDQADPNVLSRMTEIYNVLLEKVGADFVSVIALPSFTQTDSLMHKYRSDVSSSAVLDARLKASQVTKNLCHENKCTVKLANHGVPSSVVELSFSESPANGEISTSQSWSDLYRRAFCKIQAEFSCTFEVKSTSYSNKGKKEFYSGLR